MGRSDYAPDEMIPSVVELADLPSCDPNISHASLLSFDDLAFVAYDAQHPGGTIAMLRFDRVRQVTCGPNDEAFHRHPFYSLGLKHYSIQEVVDSPWIADLSALFDSSGQRDRFRVLRHFVLAFKEQSLDIAAEVVSFVGFFETHLDAMKVAAKSLASAGANAMPASNTHSPLAVASHNHLIAPLLALHHIAIICSNYPRSKHFYTQVLGFPILAEHYRPARDSYKLDLAIGDPANPATPQLELFSFPNPPPRVTSPEARGLRHLALAVTNLDAELARLATHGVAAEPIRTDEYTGHRFTFIRDPDDLPIELYEVP